MIRRFLHVLFGFNPPLTQAQQARQNAREAYLDACNRRDARDKHRTWEALHAATLRELRGSR